MTSNELNNEVLDQLIGSLNLKGMTQEELLGQNGLTAQLTKRILETALQVEMDDHLGYSKNSSAGNNSGNSRNGTSKKTIATPHEQVEINIPRDRNGDFESVIIPKHKKRVPLFNDQVLSLYGGGMTTRDIQSHLKELFGIDASPDMISRITDAVIDDFREWQNRQLDSFYPILYLDALVVKSRESGKSTNKAIYVVLGINMEGKKEILGLWISENEGAKFWMRVLNEIRNRGVEDVLIACTDGLTGFPDAIQAVFPQTVIQLCIVHMVRNSTKYVAAKDRKAVCADLRAIYSSATEDAALSQLEAFSEKWDNVYPTISQSWTRHWEDLNEFFNYPEEVRKIIYTTNAIESLNFSLRKVTKNRLAFPNDDAIFKIMFLASQKASKKWTLPVRGWNIAIHQFAIHFGDRVRL